MIPKQNEGMVRIQNKDHVFVASKDTGYAACAALARALLAKGKSCKVADLMFVHLRFFIILILYTFVVFFPDY